MRRREFIGLVGGAAAAWPFVVQAQSERLRRVAVLMDRPAETDVLERIATLKKRLEELGWVEGRNLRVDLHAGGDGDSRHVLAREMVASEPDVMVVIGNPGLAALQKETRTIPIVFVQVGNPVGSGFVASLAQPGGNTTGFMHFEPAMGGKWLEMLKEVAPAVTRALILLLSEVVANVEFVDSAQAAAPTHKVTVSSRGVRGASDIETALSEFAGQPDGGLIVLPNPVTGTHRALIAELAIRFRIPSIAAFRYMAASGALVSYGINVLNLYRSAAGYMDRILRGENPAGLPVQAPTKIELVLNAITAKALGIEIPPTLLARADEVIE